PKSPNPAERAMDRLLRRLIGFISLACWAALSAPLAAQTTPGGPADSPPPAKLVDLTALEQLLGKDLDEVAQLAREIWHVVLIPSTNPARPLVTIGTLAGGIVLLGLGYIAAGMFSRWFASKLHERFRLSKNDAAPLQSLTFYVL